MNGADRKSSEDNGNHFERSVITDNVVRKVTKVYKPISMREYFKLLAYCIVGLFTIVAVIIVTFNYLV